MGIYIFIYLVVLLFTLVDYLSIGDKKVKQYSLFFLVIVLVLFKGLRWETGTDWHQFYICFETSDWNNIFSYQRYDDGNEERMEPGYVFLNVLIKTFGNYSLFLIVTNLFIVGTWAYVCTKLMPKLPLISFAFVVVSNMIFPVRLQLAAAVVVWSQYFIIKNKIGWSFLLILVAAFIHKSTILMLPLVFLLSVRVPTFLLFLIIFLTLFSYKIVDYLLLVLLAVALVISPYYPDLASNMLTYSNSTISGYSEPSVSSIITSFAMSLIILIMITKGRAILGKKQKIFNLLSKGTNKFHFINEEDRKYNVFVNCFLLFTFMYKFFSIEQLTNFQRLAEFFTVGYALCFVYSLDLLKSKYSKSLLYVFFVFFYLYKMKNYLDTPYADLFYPYISVFESVHR